MPLYFFQNKHLEDGGCKILLAIASVDHKIQNTETQNVINY